MSQPLPRAGNDFVRRPAQQAPPAKRPLEPVKVSFAPSAQPQPQPRPATSPFPHKTFQLPATENHDKPSFWKRLQLPLVIILGIVGGVLVESAPIGQAIIGVYGLLALILHIESRTSFVVGLLALASTVIMVAIQHNSLLAHTFAGYTLLLFFVGIICAAREVREQRNLLTKKRATGRRY